MYKYIYLYIYTYLCKNQNHIYICIHIYSIIYLCILGKQRDVEKLWDWFITDEGRSKADWNPGNLEPMLGCKAGLVFRFIFDSCQDHEIVLILGGHLTIVLKRLQLGGCSQSNAHMIPLPNTKKKQKPWLSIGTINFRVLSYIGGMMMGVHLQDSY